MADQPSAVSGALRQPFREQVAFFRRKLGNRVPTRRWDDIVAAEHDTAFMVAGAQKADLLADLAAAVDRAIAEGKSLEAFRRDFDAAVARNDWHGWTGEDTKGGRAWRTRTIYRTNATTSYAAGRYAQLQAGGFPFWVYRHGGSKEPRPEHLALDGLVLAADDPAWAWLYPPSDWGCSCYVVGARSLRAARRLGGDPDKPRPAWFGQLDPATGAPIGVGRGWDYAPGARVSQAVAASARKLGGWEHQIAKAFTDELPPATRDALAQAYARLPSVRDDLRRYAQRVLRSTHKQLIEQGVPQVRTAGLITAGRAAELGKLTERSVEGFDVVIERSAILHIEQRHGVGKEADPGQRPVIAADYAQLPALVAGGSLELEQETSPSGLPVLRITQVIGGERFIAFFELRGKRRRSLALVTLYVKRAKR